MSSNKNLLKRKTLKLNHPNPLFEKWLEEWKNEAASKNSDTQFAFAKALQSLKKYPLPLKSGKECLILENFGTRICLLLDRKLNDYKKDHPDGQGSSEDANLNEIDIDNINEPTRKKAKKPITTRPIATNTHEGKGGKMYIPTLRSAPYAVLVALNEHLKKTGVPGFMNKAELQAAAQPLCDTSMFKPVAGSQYSGWSCVGQLVKRQLVQRSGNPHRYNLTQEGINLADKLPIIDMDSPKAKTSLAPKDKEKSPINFNSIKEKVLPKKPVKASKTTKECHTELAKPPSQPVNRVNIGKNLSQDSTSSQSSQDDGVIFLPGTFRIILLIDTQEIHKGDELVKELEALGVTLEVRRLKVGDFAWVGRNAEGHELLLPYIIERKRLDDLASSIKDGRFHEQKFRMKQSGVPNCMYLVESHGQRQYSLPTNTLLQAAANTQFIDRFTVKYTANSRETVVYLATFSKVITRKFSNKTLLGCKKDLLPNSFDIQNDCISLMAFKEFNKFSGKTRKYCVKEMFIKQLVQLRGLSVEKALAIVERYPSPRSLISAFQDGANDKLLADIPAGNLNRKIGPVISKSIFELYSKTVLS